MSQNPAQYHQNYEDGLHWASETQPFHSAPEVVALPSYPEVVIPNYPQLAPGPYPEAVPTLKTEYIGVAATTETPVVQASVKKRWSKRRWIITGAIIALVVVAVAVAVGCAVGLANRKANANTGASTDNSGTSSGTSSGGTSSNGTSSDGTLSGGSTSSAGGSACANTVCPQILAAAVVGSSLAVFARGNDSDMWYATAEVSALATSWPSANEWQSLGGGRFLSQPSAASWHGGDMLTVAGVLDPDHSTRLRSYNTTTAQWNASWENVGGFAQSALAMCTADFNHRLDLWVTAYSAVQHNYWVFSEDDYYAHAQGSPWQGTASLDDTVAARPAIACRDNDQLHDMILYADDDTVMHTIYVNSSSGWTSPYSYGSDYKFQGDPVAVEYASDRVDFFGIGTDKAMYHFSSSNSDGHSSMEKLGGAFESVPSAVVTGGDRIDVVALGTNHTLLHRVWKDSAWSSAWEDLGVFGDSAPLLVSLSTDPAQVAVFVLGRDGEVNQTTWTASSDASWQGLSWAGMGGNMTSSYYQ